MLGKCVLSCICVLGKCKCAVMYVCWVNVSVLSCICVFGKCKCAVMYLCVRQM